jgi:hypothetical protein
MHVLVKTANVICGKDMKRGREKRNVKEKRKSKETLKLRKNEINAKVAKLKAEKAPVE